MALQRYNIYIDDNNQTKTLTSDNTGLIFNYLIYNLHDKNDTNQPNIKFYIVDSNDNEIILLERQLAAEEKIYSEEKIKINSEDVKIYSSLKDVQVVLQLLKD